MSYNSHAVAEVLALIFFCKSCRELDEESKERVRKKNFDNVLKELRKEFKKNKKLRKTKFLNEEKKHDLLHCETEKELKKQYQDIERNKRLFYLKKKKNNCVIV